MHPRLRKDRKKRLKRRAQARYRRRHPTHRMKYGHNFVMDKIYDKSNPICMKCGRDR
jgi:hypothetical protein